MSSYSAPCLLLVHCADWTPRGFILQTGLTDIPLTANGEDTIRALGRRIAGPGKILDPSHIKHAFVSPRKRAQKTFELLFENCSTGSPEHSLEEGVREWEYGVAEGKVTKDIKAELGDDWQIWDDGCPGGESAQQMSDRCDAMIEKIVDLTSYALLNGVSVELETQTEGSQLMPFAS